MLSKDLITYTACRPPYASRRDVLPANAHNIRTTSLHGSPPFLDDHLAIHKTLIASRSTDSENEDLARLRCFHSPSVYARMEGTA